MFILKNNYMFIVTIIILLIILAYVVNITSIPDSIILFENQELDIKTITGVKLEEAITVGAPLSKGKKEYPNIEDNSMEEIKKYNLSLLGINIKTVRANIIPNSKVVPLGKIAGLKLYTKGVLVVGISSVQGEDNKIYKPYEQAGIAQGDSIIKINDENINTTEELIACVSKYKGNNIDITYIKEDGSTCIGTMTPVKVSKNAYKIGLWVRDAAAGVGTITFYDTNTGSIAALGHGIQDVDTEKLVEISSGEFVTTEIIEIEKGRENNPGKISGTIEESEILGKIYSNTEFGVYGVCKNKEQLKINTQNEIDVARRNEIQIGKASILCTLENNVTKEYEVEIKKIYINNNENNKSMIVEVTDPELIEKTGGIIQGMSGSPIIQNGKLIGALTHVLVSNPTRRIWGICRYNDKAIKMTKKI